MFFPLLGVGAFTSEQLRYCQSMNYIAAALLLYLDEERVRRLRWIRWILRTPPPKNEGSAAIM